MKKLKILFLLLTVSLFAPAQERSVYGTIRDSRGEPLPGVNIVVKGTTIGAQADFDGNYSIKAKPTDTLVFSFTGMVNQRWAAENIKINLMLKEYDDSNDCIGEEPNLSPAKRSEKRSIATLTGDKKLDKKIAQAEKKRAKEAERDLKNKDNPKYNFKKNIKPNGWSSLYKKDNCYFKKDLAFQVKYHVVFSLTRAVSNEYAEKFNNLVFRHLNKKHGKDWQSEVRKDLFGLEEFLKAK